MSSCPTYRGWPPLPYCRSRDVVLDSPDHVIPRSCGGGLIVYSCPECNTDVLCGRDAVGLNNQLEDAATVEISRSQIWQWVHNGTKLDDGTVIDRELVVKVLDEELAKIRAETGEETWRRGRPEETRQVRGRLARGRVSPIFSPKWPTN